MDVLNYAIGFIMQAILVVTATSKDTMLDRREAGMILLIIATPICDEEADVCFEVPKKLIGPIASMYRHLQHNISCQDTISACLPAGDALAAQAEIATGTLLVHVLKKEDEQLNRKGAGAKQVSNAADTLNKTRGS